jgi:5-methylcytosine-specific restriction endonuclease McrA
MTTRTLLLTPWYVPIQILQWQDAIKMVYEETVDVIVEYDEEVRSPSVTWRMPAVVRLRRLKRERSQNPVKFSRVNVYTRDARRCQYCGERFDEADLSYDHVVPKRSGGRRTWANIVTACKACNSHKGSRSCDEAGMWPIRSPREPSSLPLAGPRIDVEYAPAEWQDFLGAWAR